MAGSSRSGSPSRNRRGEPRSRSISDLPPPPKRKFYGVQQRKLGWWVSEIRDRDTSKRYWLVPFSSPELAARVYDIKAVGLYGSRAKINFPLGSRDVPQPVGIDPRVVSRHEVRENRLAF